MKKRLAIGIFYDMVCGVGGAHRDGKNEISGGKAKQYEDQRFAYPTRQESFKNGKTALPAGALPGDKQIGGQGAQECEQD